MLKILTDSTADMPPALRGHPLIEIIPLKVVTPQETYLDRVNLDTEQFLKLLKSSNTLPTTSQPSAGEFEAKYQEMMDNGATEILSVHISSKLSGTISSAHAALKNMPGAPITVFDSLSTSIGLGLLVSHAVKAVEAGKPASEVLSMLERLRDRVFIGFVVDTLEYLAKGGRIGRASALMGSLLNVKPVLTLTGVVEPLDKARSKRKGILRAMDYLEERLGTECPVTVGITQLAAEDDALAVKEAMEKRFDCVETYIAELSPVIGIHTGPGTVGIGACPAL